MLTQRSCACPTAALRAHGVRFGGSTRSSATTALGAATVLSGIPDVSPYAAVQITAQVLCTIRPLPTVMTTCAAS